MVQHIVKVMVLGETGMLGHMAKAVMNNVKDIEVIPAPQKRITDYDSLVEYVSDVMESDADFIVNALGVVKPRIKDVGVNNLYLINSVLPAMLYTNRGDKKIIHISSDCVWDGNISPDLNYDFYSKPNATDDYGKSKALGEVGDCVLRTSIIGPELNGQKRGLLMNLLTADEIQGWDHHKWSGVTTLELTKYIMRRINEFTTHGFVQKKLHLVGSPPVTKYELAMLINVVFELNKDVKFVSNEQTVNRAFASHVSPPLVEQLIELKKWMDDYEY